MKAQVVATVMFDMEIGTKSDKGAEQWLREDIETVLDAWQNGYENVKVPAVQIQRIPEGE